MATTLSYGETITILLKAIVSVLAKGGQDPRKGSGFLGRQLLGSRLCTLAPGTIFAGGGGVAATFDVVRRGRRDPALSLRSRPEKERTRSSFDWCSAAALQRGWSTTLAVMGRLTARTAQARRQHFAGASKSDRHDHLFVCLLSRRELLAVSCLIELTLYGSTLWTQWSIRGFAGQLMMINAFAQCASRAARQRGQQGVELLRSLHEYLGGRR